MTLHAVSPALTEHTIRVWIEARRLDQLTEQGIRAGLPEHEAHRGWGRLTLTLRVQARRGVDAIAIGHAAVRDAIEAACPSLDVTGMGASCVLDREGWQL